MKIFPINNNKIAYVRRIHWKNPYILCRILILLLRYSSRGFLVFGWDTLYKSWSLSQIFFTGKNNQKDVLDLQLHTTCAKTELWIVSDKFIPFYWFQIGVQKSISMVVIVDGKKWFKKLACLIWQEMKITMRLL